MMRAAAAIELAGRAAERRIFGDAADDFLAVNVGFASESDRRADIAQGRLSAQQPASGRSSRVGVTQISCSPILIDASADRHFKRDMAW